MQFPIINPDLIARKGEQIYERLKGTLEKEHKGKFAAIEVENERYFLGDTPEEALDTARKEFPNRIFHLMRVGFPGVYELSRFAPVRKFGLLRYGGLL